ncbi:aspartic peptidase domain-containing protein [Vararia minispora EC-137]|uniref:Aspartic peptidase domain-containing protein n=1 Tax=Vararia minispora EC-137 TaxID=1314806 RepID=A0ACB8QMA5_9AGAM|nr:aspartic peptidase domain-containing protein [Vararia minispora EC-137]
MQLTLPFAVLLTTILALYSVSEVDAHPLAKARAPNGRITLPLKRVVRRTDVHPEVYLQQHLNRAHRRYARMTGREEPSTEALTRALEKRVASIEARGLQVRSGRLGYAAQGMTSSALVNVAEPGKGKNKGNGTAAAAGAAGAAAGAGAATAAGAGAATAAGTGAAAAAAAGTAAASGANTGNAGFPAASAQAAASNSLAQANTPTTANSVGLDIEANDVSYVSTVQLGTPPKNFNVIMDSGSADFWVAGDNCQTCAGHQLLGASTSSSFVDTQQPFSVTYGSGNVQGNIVTDTLTLAGLTLTNHTFGTATAESAQFAQDPNSDGLMGLAQSTLSSQGVLTPVESLAQQGLISNAITSFKISRLADQKNDGEVTFGALDTTKFDSTTLVTLNNVNTQGFWEVNVGGFSVNGQDVGLAGRTAIMDTGTTLIIAPPADAQALMSAVPGAQSDGQGGFTVPCTTNATIALTLGGTTFNVDPRDLAFLPTTNNLAGNCVAGVSSGQIGGATEWLVGDVFLKNAYFSTDVAKNQISFAKLI